MPSTFNLRHVGKIGNSEVATNYPIVVFGVISGFISRHKTIRGAKKTLSRHDRKHRKNNAIPDGHIYVWRNNAWHGYAGE